MFIIFSRHNPQRVVKNEHQKVFIIATPTLLNHNNQPGFLTKLKVASLERRRYRLHFDLSSGFGVHPSPRQGRVLIDHWTRAVLSIWIKFTKTRARQQQIYLCELCPATYNTSLRGFYVGIVPKKMNTIRCSFLFRPFDAQKFIDQETSTDCQSIQINNHGQT